MATRILGLFIVVAGILTFFCSSVTVAPPVASAASWSPMKIVVRMYDGALPPPICERCGEPLVRSLLALPFFISVEYLLLLLALIAQLFRWPSRVTIYIAVFGIGSMLRGGWSVGTRLEFLETFYGLSSRGEVHYNELVITQLVIMVALLLTSLDLLDGEIALQRKRRSWPVDGDETRHVIAAEIVAEDEATQEPPRKSHHLHE